MVNQHNANPKPLQHHVWQKYLRSWSDGEGKVCCLQNNRVFATGTAVLGAERYFYKVPDLTEQDLALLNWLALGKADPQLRSHHELLINNVLGPILFVRRNRDSLNNLHLIDKVIEAHSTNAVDNQHTMLEGFVDPLLSRALAGDIRWYNNVPDCIAFCNFIAAQHMRTTGVKSKTIRRLQEHMGLDISRIWDILALTYGFNIGRSLFLERKRRELILIKNESAMPFVTSDQPVTNLYGTGEAPPSMLSFYYPISPWRALYLGEPDEATRIAREPMSEAAVTGLNLTIAKKSYRQIYAHAPVVLEVVRDRLNQAA